MSKSLKIEVGSEIEISFTLNGEPTTVGFDPRRSLADVLREDCGQTGTHLGCEHGVCGACTVLVDGAPSRSCLLLGAMVDGRTVTTIEGLAVDGEFNDVQKGMQDALAFQCGFCTPGFLMSTVALLEENQNPTEAEIREELSGNLCRCTGYQSIVDGVMAALRHRNGTAEPPPPTDPATNHRAPNGTTGAGA